jgi:hypothetical protein
MSRSIGMFLSGYIVIAIAFNNCSSVHEGSASLSSFSTCNLILKDVFSSDYYPFLKKNCNSCHVTGGAGNGTFADDHIDIAFDAFLIRGNNLIGSRALDINHKSPYTGPQHNSEIKTYDEAWNAAKVQTDRCLESAGENPTTVLDAGVIPEDPVPTQGTVQTYTKVINASATKKTIKWNLGTEIKTAGIKFTNAELSIDVTANTTINGEKSYIFSNPKLKAGDQSLHIMYIDFIINNQLVPEATSYHIINRRVAAGATKDLGVGSITFVYNFQSTDSVTLSIGLLDSIDFNPPTFTELISPTGVFGANCLSCHDSVTKSGGFDISTRTLVLQQLLVSPYNPNNSEIFKRMNNSQSPMPQQGLLPESEVSKVLQWIQNGAL